jgi:hypothetical protein
VSLSARTTAVSRAARRTSSATASSPTGPRFRCLLMRRPAQGHRVSFGARQMLSATSRGVSAR